MKKKIINKRVNGDSEELHALKSLGIFHKRWNQISNQVVFEHHQNNHQQLNVFVPYGNLLSFITRIQQYPVKEV